MKYNPFLDLSCRMCKCLYQPYKCICYTHWVDNDQQSIICPGAQFHATVLQVEREMEDDNLTVALKDGWRVPCYQPSVLQQAFGFVDDGKVTVSTAKEDDRDRGEEECERRRKMYCMYMQFSYAKRKRMCVYMFTCCITPGRVSKCLLKGF